MSRISKKNIVLIGFMASGKSVVAKRLAKRLKMPIIDTDVLIENEKGMKIKEIFKIHGEHYFRKLEKGTVKKLSTLRRIGFIISTGGGIVLNPVNRRLLRKCGTVFYLKASPDAILRRIKKIRDNERPLLMDKPDLKNGIKRLLKIREPYYRVCAHNVINTSSMKVQEVVDRIIKIVLSCRRKLSNLGEEARC